MKQTKRKRRVKVPALPQFDRFLYDELYVPVKKAWGENDIMKYERNMYGDSK